jgi:hypothetical protein
MSDPVVENVRNIISSDSLTPNEKKQEILRLLEAIKWNWRTTAAHATSILKTLLGTEFLFDAHIMASLLKCRPELSRGELADIIRSFTTRGELDERRRTSMYWAMEDLLFYADDQRLVDDLKVFIFEQLLRIEELTSEQQQKRREQLYVLAKFAPSDVDAAILVQMARIEPAQKGLEMAVALARARIGTGTETGTGSIKNWYELTSMFDEARKRIRRRILLDEINAKKEEDWLQMVIFSGGTLTKPEAIIDFMNNGQEDRLVALIQRTSRDVLEKPDAFNVPPLLLAVQTSSVACVRAMLARGVDPNAVDPAYNWTAILYALQLQNTATSEAIVHALCDAGALLPPLSIMESVTEFTMRKRVVMARYLAAIEYKRKHTSFRELMARPYSTAELTGFQGYGGVRG